MFLRTTQRVQKPRGLGRALCIYALYQLDLLSLFYHVKVFPENTRPPQTSKQVEQSSPSGKIRTALNGTVCSTIVSSMTREEESALCSTPPGERGERGDQDSARLRREESEGQTWGMGGGECLLHGRTVYFTTLVSAHQGGDAYCKALLQASFFLALGEDSKLRLGKVKSRVQSHRVATEQGTGVRGPASRSRCPGGGRTADPRPGERSDQEYRREGRFCAGAFPRSEAPGSVTRWCPPRTVKGPQTAGSRILSGKHVSEPLLCLRSCPLPAATHRSPEKSSQCGRHLRCARDSRDWMGRGGEEEAGRTGGGYGAGPRGAGRGLGWSGGGKRSSPRFRRDFCPGNLIVGCPGPISEEKSPAAASK